MAKALSKDEKKFIFNELKEYSLKFDYNTQINNAIQTYMINNATTKLQEFIKECKCTSASDIKFRYNYDNYIELSYYNTNNNITYFTKVQGNDVLIKEIRNINNLNINYRDFQCYNDDLLVKYYVIFTTWEFKKSERLNKIKELIEIIKKDLLK